MHRVQRLPRSLLFSTASPSSFLSPRAPGPPARHRPWHPAPSSYPLRFARLAAAPTPPRSARVNQNPASAAAAAAAAAACRPTRLLEGTRPPPMLRCHTTPQCGRAPLRLHGRRESPPASVVVRCARGAPQVTGIEVASAGHVAATAAKAEGGDARPSLAERLRLGSLLEDGLSYKESFIVRCYEVGINKTATVETIANLLQEVGCNHAQSVGFSTDGFATTTTMRKLGLIWVTNRMHIEIYKYPAWGDVVEIETWCQEDGRIGTRRDWILKDLANGEVIGRATSKWVMMNQNTRRLQRVSDDVRDEVFIHCPKTPRLAFPEENNGSLKKIPNLSDPAQYSRLGLVPRRADLDMNQHVNNVTYIGWVLESIPQDIIDTHELQTITLDYRRECQHDDIVDSLTYIEEGEEKSMNGSASAAPHKEEQQQFLHCLRFAGNGDEINRGRTVWRKLAR